MTQERIKTGKNNKTIVINAASAADTIQTKTTYYFHSKLAWLSIQRGMASS